MALKKSELYSSLWSGCDELRGGMDASQYKDYVLVLLFIKYVSDKYAGVPFAPIIIPAGASFRDMVAIKGNPEIGDLINKRIIGPLANANKKDKKGKEKDKGWACDLVPKSLIVSRYFANEQEALEQLVAELESVTAQITELEEEQSSEEGAFSELDKVNKANVTSRLKELQAEKKAEKRQPNTSNVCGTALMAAEATAPYDAEGISEADILLSWLNLSNQEAELKKALKEAEAALDAKAYAYYPKLTEAEIQALVVDDKWLAAVDAAIHGEMDRISQALTQRVKELAERYETPMPQMASRVTELEAKVNGHLERMGFAL